LHSWNASIDDIEHPDLLVFDLDPGEGVDWDFVIETALKLRRMLEEEGLEPWPKLTGGKGLHLMAPVEPKIDHDEARAYAKQIARRLASTAPDRYTLASAPGKRTGRIFIDYLLNGRGTTAIGAWSPGRHAPGRDSNCGPGELARGRGRYLSGRIHDGQPAAQVARHDATGLIG
jgi:bifunctional non-homologous end joining protein LigD